MRFTCLQLFTLHCSSARTLSVSLRSKCHEYVRERHMERTSEAHMNEVNDSVEYRCDLYNNMVEMCDDGLLCTRTGPSGPAISPPEIASIAISARNRSERSENSTQLSFRWCGLSLMSLFAPLRHGNETT